MGRVLGEATGAPSLTCCHHYDDDDDDDDIDDDDDDVKNDDDDNQASSPVLRGWKSWVGTRCKLGEGRSTLGSWSLRTIVVTMMLVMMNTIPNAHLHRAKFIKYQAPIHF